MTRDLLWLAVLNVLWLAAGLGVTGAAGWWSGRRPIRALGVSYLAGVAAYGVTAQAALVAGASMTRWQIVLVCAALSCGAVPALSRMSAPSPANHRVAWAAAIVLTALTALAVDLWFEPVWAYDAWTYWNLRAHGLASLGGLDVSWFTAPEMRDPDYPLLLPVVEAAGFRFTGYETALLDLQSLLFLGGALRAYFEVVVPRGPRWAPILPVLVVTAPSVADQLAAAEADIPLAAFFACAAVFALIWRRERSRAALILFAVFAAGAAATKVEGLPFVVALVVAFGVPDIKNAPRAAGALLAAGAVGLVAGLAPWRVWLRIHHVADQAPLSRILDVRYLVDHVSRAKVAAPYLAERLVDPSRWLLLVPLLAVLTVRAVRQRRRDAWPVVAALGLALVAMLVAYWTSPFEIHYHLATSARRVVTGPILAWTFLLPLLWQSGDP